ncbi:MAG: DUF4249 domain-containing protein [Cyclobacteriaceae bacterium]
MKYQIPFLSLIAVFFFGCINEFAPDIPSAATRLVIEGGITNNPGPYYIKLSKTEQLDFTIVQSTDVFEPTTNAQVTISDLQGNEEILTEVTSGLYATDLSGNGIRGEIGQRYQLSIVTSTGEVYQSTFDEMLPVPELDSVSLDFEFADTEINSALDPLDIFNFAFPGVDSSTFVNDLGPVVRRTELNGIGGFLIGTEASLGSSIPVTPPTQLGMRVRAVTQDPIENRNYYRWRVFGTFDAFTQPERFVVIGDVANPNSSQPVRNFYNIPRECCSRCWVDFELTDLFLSDDRLSNGQRLVEETALIPLNNFVFQNRVYLNVEQQSLNLGAYQFYQGIEKQISDVGGIFDTAPALSISNITNPDDPEDIVLGYFIVAGVSTKSRWVTRRQLPVGVGDFLYPDDCRNLSNQILTSTTNRPAFWPD